MTALRRTAVLIGLIAAVLVGTSIPASATFTASEAVATSVTTATVTAPTNVVLDVRCDSWNLYATIRWTGSNAPKVSGYRIAATVPGMPTMEFTATAGASRYDHSMGRAWAAYPISVTVTTLTAYGWTKTSAVVTGTSC